MTIQEVYQEERMRKMRKKKTQI